MNMTRWSDRGSALDRSRRFGDVDRIFQDFLQDWSSPPLWSGRGCEEDFFPHVDLKDYENEYVMVADLPGVAKDKLDLNVAGDRLFLKGCYEEETESGRGAECYYCQERYTGCFERTIPLPGEVDVDGVKATLHDGVLTMHLPKTGADRVRRIELTEQ